MREAASKFVEYVKTLRNSKSRREEELKAAHAKIREKNERLAGLRKQLKEQERELSELRGTLADIKEESEGIEQEDIVWIFGAGRTGSTWLAAMMGEMEGHRIWPEPQLGELFDRDRLKVGDLKSEHGSFVFSPRHEEALLRSVGNFVLQGARSRFPKETKTLVIKEPHGSAGAPLLVRALPKSRVILLMRDPRDTVASALDAFQKGMWRDGWKGMYSGTGETADDFVKEASLSYLRHMGGAKEAYDYHSGPKVLVRYEELVSNSLDALRCVYSGLDMDIEEEELVQSTNKHSWENIPEDKKGQGKFYRKGRPGSWSEDLTSGQASLVEEITAPILKEFYFG